MHDNYPTLTLSQVSGNEDNDHRRSALDDDSPSSPSVRINTPISSRPPSFSSLDPLDDRNERYELAASFQPEDDDDEEDDTVNEHTRLHRRVSEDSIPSTSLFHSTRNSPPSSITPPLLAVPSPFARDENASVPSVSSRFVARSGTDGVFANLEAKPDFNSPDEKYDEPLPSYEAAAADAVPPYWETTIITPGIDSDEVYVDGLPVGTFFSFVWKCND